MKTMQKHSATKTSGIYIFQALAIALYRLISGHIIIF